MKFAVGYRLQDEDEESLVDIVKDFRDRIDEVYFPWLDMPSGRSPMTDRGGVVDWSAQERMERDLRALSDMGVKLDLLLNASCYGRYGFSRYLANRVCSVVEHINGALGLDAVTTMSPMIAKTVKENFPDVDVRASVNMRLGTVKGMMYIADLFDSFYLQRECNRNIPRIEEIKAWCEDEGKGLHLLGNSGCLNFCSVQTFHDNLVAHEREATEMLSVDEETPALCWKHLKEEKNWIHFLQNSWIRPEDVALYEPYVSSMKLATRMHENPRMVIQAYCEGKFGGNLPNLFEPSHASLFAPYIIDNGRFPEDWFARSTACGGNCTLCGYCASVLARVLVHVDDVVGS